VGSPGPVRVCGALEGWGNQEACMKAKLVSASIVVVLALVVLAQNTEVVTFRFLFWSARISQVLLVLLTLALGFFLGFLVAKLTGRGKKRPGRTE